MTENRSPGRPRDPEGDLTDLQRRDRQRWRTCAAARYAAKRPQREAERLIREAASATVKATKPVTRKAPSKASNRRRKVAKRSREGIPPGDKRPW